jgi:hypothetical protein
MVSAVAPIDFTRDFDSVQLYGRLNVLGRTFTIQIANGGHFLLARSGSLRCELTAGYYNRVWLRWAMPTGKAAVTLVRKWSSRWFFVFKAMRK